MPKNFIHGERMNLRVLGLFCIVSLLMIPHSLNAGEELDAFLDLDAIRDAWESTYGSIRTMRVEYSSESSVRIVNKEYQMVREDVKRIEQGELHYTEYSYGINTAVNSENTIFSSFDGEKSCEYFSKDMTGSIQSGLLGKSTDNMNLLKRFMLMDDLPVMSGKGQMQSSIPRFLLYMNCTNVKVGEKLEYVAGEACHVVTIISKSEEYNADSEIKIWVAHNKGMLPLKVETRDYIKDFEESVEVSEVSSTELNSDKVWYPQKVHCKTDHAELGAAEATVVIKEFEPNIEIDESAFKVVFPTGARVADNVMGITYVVGGENTLVDIENSISRDKQKTDDTESDNNPKAAHDGYVEQIKDKADMATMGLVDNRPVSGIHLKQHFLIVLAGVIFLLTIMGALLLNCRTKNTKQSGV